MKTSKPLYIKVHATDNVAIVVNSGGLPAGTVFDDGLTLREHVPQGHKVALADLAQDAAILRYGEVIGYAEQAIPCGSWIEESLVRLPEAPPLASLPLANKVPVPLPGLGGSGKVPARLLGPTWAKFAACAVYGPVVTWVMPLAL